MNEKEKSLPIEMQVAVIGIAGRFPGSRNIQEFWQSLCDGTELISFFSAENPPPQDIRPGLINEPGFVPAKGALQEPEYFDARFFGYSRREAEAMDPQMRIFHECVWEALEDAGYNPESRTGSIGIFAGASANVYWQGMTLLNRSRSSGEQFAALSLADKNFMNAQIAYKLNLHGPVVTVDSACSTSLVAIHLACRALLTGECSMAVAGGVSVPLPSPGGYLYEEGMILSPDGHCRAFDAQAAGTVPGEGAGAVILKPLKRALADGDHIYAVVRGSAINNDGKRKVNFTAPSIEGQAEVIRTAHRRSMTGSESISYVEAHGTGTALGDPIEFAALKSAFGTPQQVYCRLGSVKTNIGHLDAASGVAGFLKTVLALKHEQIPPSLHYTQANPAIDFVQSPFQVADRLLDWKRGAGEGPRRAGVSSFGIGGTNAHVILQEAPVPVAGDVGRSPYLLVLSARSQEALKEQAQRLGAYLRTHEEVLADVAYTLQVGRAAFGVRRAVVCRSWVDAVEQLERIGNIKDRGGVVAAEDAEGLFWLYPGQGSWYEQMGRGLYEREAVYRDWIDRGLHVLREAGVEGYGALGYGVSEAEREAGVGRLGETAVGQPLLFVVEYALTKQLEAWGLVAQGMLGHSLGEIVAACVAEVFPFEVGVRLVAERGRQMGRMAAGAMLSVEIEAEEGIEGYLSAGVGLAAHNGPGRWVLAGEREALALVKGQVEHLGKQSQWLGTKHAFHTAAMREAARAWVEYLKGVELQEPKRRFLSNVTGQWITTEQAMDPAYWGEQMCAPVRFAEGVQTLAGSGGMVMEVGPGRSLGSLARKVLGKGEEQRVVSLLRHEQEERSDLESVQEGVGKWWERGGKVDWERYDGRARRRRVSLPTYPFQRQRFWPNTDLGNGSAIESSLKSFLKLGTSAPAASVHCYAPTWERQPLPVLSADRSTPSFATYLVFGDDYGVVQALVEHLNATGSRVIRVSRSSAYARQNDALFSINPVADEDYQTLISTLCSRYGAIDKVIHCWSLTESLADREPGMLQQASALQNMGYNSLLSLARALGELQTAPVHITIATNNLFAVTGLEPVCPAQALLLGPAQIIPQEYQQITSSLVDLSLSEEQATEQILAALSEKRTEDPAGRVVALRGKHRWQRIFKPLELASDRSIQSRPGGTYLLTGGLGAIALALAEALAKPGPVNLVLIARAAFPEWEAWDEWAQMHPQDQQTQTIQRLQALERSGSTVMIVRADVSSREQMHEAIKQALQRFQTINGVLHCAGVADGALIHGRTAAWDQRVLAAKVQGTLLLDELLSTQPLDFVVLCSALSAVVAPIGQVGYVAANSFLDAYAQYKNMSGPTRWLSIGWDSWKDAGMAVDANRALQANALLTTYQERFSEQADTGLSEEEGRSVFLRLLASSTSHALVSTAPLEKKLDEHRASLLFYANQKGADQANVAKKSLTNREEVEQQISDIWKAFLGVEAISLADNWFDLGLSSLDIIQLTSLLNTTLGTDVSVPQLFTFHTIQSLAGFLCKKETPAVADLMVASRDVQVHEGQARLKQRLERAKRV